MKRTLVKITTSENCISFRTISRSGKSRQFYVTRSEFARLEHEPEVITRDIWSFAVLRRDKDKDTLSVQFTWLSGDGTNVKGSEETVTLRYSELAAFVQANEGEGAEYRALSLDWRAHRPRLVFNSGKNLRAAVSNGTVRRKLSRALRDSFQWPGAEQITLSDDFVPYSFFFRETRGGQQVLCGGLILHGQEDMSKAYYGLHT